MVVFVGRELLALAECDVSVQCVIVSPLVEFARRLGACTPLTSTLTILYTTDHELLAEWSIGLSTAATVPGPPTFPSGTGPRGSSGSDAHSYRSAYRKGRHPRS